MRAIAIERRRLRGGWGWRGTDAGLTGDVRVRGVLFWPRAVPVAGDGGPGRAHGTQRPKFTAGHSGIISRQGPDQARPFIADADNPRIYQPGGRWGEALGETDGYRQAGALELAEKQYLEIIEKLRQAQGPKANDVAAMLAHVGEFYLEARDFERAYQNFAQAAEIEKANLPPAIPIPTPCTGNCLGDIVKNYFPRIRLIIC